MHKGKYFPAEYSMFFIRQAIEENPEKFRNGFILDGFPRRLEDAKKFEAFLRNLGFQAGNGKAFRFEVGGVLYCRIPEELSIVRQNYRMREDPGANVARQKEFDEQEAKVIAWYKSRGMVKTIVSTPVRKKTPQRGPTAVKWPRGASDLEFKPFVRHFAGQGAKMVNNWLGKRKRGKFARKRAAQARRLK